jgi:hypothetical protein
MRNTIEWGKSKFHEYRKAVAYVAVIDASGDRSIGTAFHVGNGVYLTARHAVDGYELESVSVDEGHDPFGAFDATEPHTFNVISEFLFHTDDRVDLACFVVNNPPDEYINLGGHLDCFLGGYELLLHKTLVLGFPKIPMSKSPHLIASVGEVNGLLEEYHGNQLLFVISTMARGGFSGGPVLVAYDEENTITGTALLGIVTRSLIENNGNVESGFMAVTTVQPIYDLLEHHNLLPEFQEIEYDAHNTC